MKRLICLGLTLALLLSAGFVQAETVKHGSKGDTVRQVQTALQTLGYYKGAIDGIFGDALFTAVWWFQKDKGMAADGIAGEATQTALGLGGTALPPAGSLSHGASGAAVLRLQNALKTEGFYRGELNGRYDDATFSAVWQYQRAKGLAPDGVASPQVQSMLNVNNASPVPPVQSGGVSFKVGSSGETVRAIQLALYKLSYFAGPVDGVYGNQTFTAVWRYQRDKGLAPDGVAGYKTLQSLGVSYTQSSSVQLPAGMVLSFGSSGEYVRVLQTGLKNLGYYTGEADGRYGNATYKAVWWFQKDNGMTVDGKVSSLTWNVLFAGSGGGNVVSGTLRYGDRGEAVLALQRRLTSLKYNPGSHDGVYGQNTYIAVRDFQQNNRLAVDGVAGTNTLNALNSASAVTKP